MTKNSSAESTNDDGSASSPRAFAIGTGSVFQTVGSVFLLGSCCFWSLSGRVVARASQPAAHWGEYLTGDRLPAAVLMIGVVTTLIGGIGLVGVGIGLTGERPGSGRAGLLLTAVMGIIYSAATVLLALYGDSWLQCLPAAAFTAGTLVLFLLAAHSASVLSRFPPPPNQNVVTDEQLQADRERRRR